MLGGKDFVGVLQIDSDSIDYVAKYNVPCRYFNHTLITVYFYHVCVIRQCSVLCMNLRETSDFVLRKCLFPQHNPLVW